MTKTQACGHSISGNHLGGPHITYVQQQWWMTSQKLSLPPPVWNDLDAIIIVISIFKKFNVHKMKMKKKMSFKHYMITYYIVGWNPNTCSNLCNLWTMDACQSHYDSDLSDLWIWNDLPQNRNCRKLFSVTNRLPLFYGNTVSHYVQFS